MKEKLVDADQVYDKNVKKRSLNKLKRYKSYKRQRFVQNNQAR